MKNTVPFLALAIALLLNGCASAPLVSGITVVPVDGARAFELRNDSGQNLYDVRLSATMFAAGRWHATADQKLGEWHQGEMLTTLPLNLPANAVIFDGRCKGARIKARWSDGSPVPEIVDMVPVPH